MLIIIILKKKEKHTLFYNTIIYIDCLKEKLFI